MHPVIRRSDTFPGSATSRRHRCILAMKIYQIFASCHIHVEMNRANGIHPDSARMERNLPEIRIAGRGHSNRIIHRKN
jgi:hypothetical protein